MKIAGIGIIYRGGRGIESLKKDFLSGDTPMPKTEKINGKEYNFFNIKNDDLKDVKLSRQLRRADKFTKLSLLAANDAIKDSGIELEKFGDASVILSTGYGPHSTTFSFLDDILEYGEKSVSPIKFSHSVHNSAVSYISMNLKINGRCLTITDFNAPFYKSLLSAQSMLGNSQTEYVIVGGTDEISQTMKYISAEKSNKKGHIFGEGSVFFVLTNEKTKTDKNYCSISSPFFIDTAEKLPSANMCVLDIGNMICNNEDKIKSLKQQYSIIEKYYPYFGEMASISAFNCAVSAINIDENNIKNTINISPFSQGFIGVELGQ